MRHDDDETTNSCDLRQSRQEGNNDDRSRNRQSNIEHTRCVGGSITQTLSKALKKDNIRRRKQRHY